MNHTEYDLMYRNMREPDTSSEEEEDEEEEIEQENLVNYRNKIFNFVINSGDRDWSGTYTDTFSFQVKFGGDSDTFETYRKTYIENIGSNNKVYQVSTETNKYLGTKVMSFPINVKNIESISVQSLVMPKRLYYLGGANYRDILDFNYLTISVEEISNCYYGTNSALNKSIALMFPLSVVYKNTGAPNHVEFRDKGGLIREFKPAPINCFDNLNFKINDSMGNPLKFKNDILTINSIQTDTSDFLNIKVNERFNGEYRNGDLIKFKNFSGSSIDKKLIDFLNREEGHLIYMDNSFEDTTHNSTYTLKNEFKILSPGDYNDDGVYTKESYIPEDTDYNTDITGKVLNTNLQFTMFLKIESKVMEFSNLNSKII